MREFEDDRGVEWVATVGERPGEDYKGRFHLLMKPVEDGEQECVELVDVRWNSIQAAERTLQTMSVAELKKRHRSAVGRGVFSL